MLAVSMLSVDVPARASLNLIASDDARQLLAEIPAVTIWDDPALLDLGQPAWKLWDIVRAQDDIGPTIASKLLAAKRPALLPVHDQHVANALEFGPSDWGFWQQVASDPDASALTSAVQEVMAEASVPSNVSVLRGIDVVVWMVTHGWTSHRACTIGCDFDGFGDPGA